MKVIFGSTDGQWKTQVECGSCKAVLEVNKEGLYVANMAMAYAGESWEPVMRDSYSYGQTCTPWHQVPDVYRGKKKS